MKKLALFIIFSLPGFAFPILAPAKQIYFDLDLSLGQNTNITQSKDGDGAFLSQAGLSFALPFGLKDADGELFCLLDYIEYAQKGYDLKAKMGATFSRAWLEDKLFLTLTAAGRFYRTKILPEDEINSAEIEAVLDYGLSYKKMFFLSQKLAYEDYLENYTLGPKKICPLSSRGRNGKGRDSIEEEYENLISTTKIGLEQILSPGLETEYYLGYQVCASKVEPESFQGFTLGGELYAYLSPDWEAGFGARASFFQFHDIKAKEQREDFEVQAWIFLLRKFKKFDLFYTLSYINNHSSWEEGAFQGMVNKCGLSFAF